MIIHSGGSRLTTLLLRCPQSRQPEGQNVIAKDSGGKPSCRTSGWSSWDGVLGKGPLPQTLLGEEELLAGLTPQVPACTELSVVLVRKPS